MSDDDRPLQDNTADEITYAAAGLCIQLAIHTDNILGGGGGLYDHARELITGMAKEIEALRVERDVAQHRLGNAIRYYEELERTNQTMQNSLKSCQDKLERLNTLTYLQSLDRE